MTAKDLKNALLQEAVQGKLVPQIASEGNARDLLEEIRKEKSKLVKEGKIKKEKQTAEITEEEKPFEIPNNWSWTTIGNIAFVTKLAGFEYSSTIAPNLTTKGIPLFKGKNIQNSEVIYNFEGYIPEGISDELARSQITRKCLLTPYVGTIGNIGIHNREGKYHLGSNVGKIETYCPNLTLDEYLFYYLKSPQGYEELTKFKKATAQESISIDAIRQVYIPLPPLAEQKRIVAAIEKFMPLIEEYGKKETELKAFNKQIGTLTKKAILQEAVQGKLVPQIAAEGNAKDLFEEIKKEKAKLIKEGKIKKEKPLPEITEDEIPFDIPENWCWCRLGEIVYNNGQKNPDKEFSYIDIGSIDNEHQKLNEKENFIQPQNAPSRARKIVKKGDIIYSTVRPYLHNMCIIDKDFEKEPIASTGFAVLSCYPQINNQYLFYYLLSPSFDNYANDTENSKGVAYPAINDDRLYKGVVPIPPLTEQKRIVAAIEKLLPFCERLGEEK